MWHGSFFNAGYKAGYEHGQAHGTFDGRALGQEKGFELWEELGYIQGQAKFWLAVYANDPGKKRCVCMVMNELWYTDIVQYRAGQNAEQLLSLIDQFPAENDSKTQQDQDVEALLQNIRSKYRVVCASFGVRPRLQAVQMSM